MIQGIREAETTSEDLLQLINMCLQFNPKDRPAASEMLDALNKVGIKLFIKDINLEQLSTALFSYCRNTV